MFKNNGRKKIVVNIEETISSSAQLYLFGSRVDDNKKGYFIMIIDKIKQDKKLFEAWKRIQFIKGVL